MGRRWFPFYPGDYLRDTGHLNAAEHGGYILLIMHYWMHGGLPRDEANLRRITCMTPMQWARGKAKLQAFFGPDWRHKRIDADLWKAVQNSARAVERGRAGGRKTAERLENLLTTEQQTFNKFRGGNVENQRVMSSVRSSVRSSKRSSQLREERERESSSAADSEIPPRAESEKRLGGQELEDAVAAGHNPAIGANGSVAMVGKLVGLPLEVEVRRDPEVERVERMIPSAETMAQLAAVANRRVELEALALEKRLEAAAAEDARDAERAARNGQLHS